MGFLSNMGNKIKGAIDGSGAADRNAIKNLRKEAIHELRDATDPTNREELAAAQQQAQQIGKGQFDGQLQTAQAERTGRINELRDRTDPTNPDELAAAQRQAQQIASGPLRAGLNPEKQTVAKSEGHAAEQSRQNQR